MKRVNRLICALCLLSLIAAGTSATAGADATTDLAAAEEKLASASAALTEDKERVEDERNAFAPTKRAINEAVHAARQQLAKAKILKHEMVEERMAAKKTVEAATSEYDDAKSHHETLRNIGIALFALALVVGIAVYFLRRKIDASKRRMADYLGGALAAVLAVAGIGLIVLPSTPDKPEISDETAQLAEAAEGNPLRPPRPDVVRETEAVIPLVREGKKLQREASPALHKLEQSEEEVEDDESVLASAKKDYTAAQLVVAHEEKVAEEEASFKEEATAIDYDQLIKNPFNYIGEKVVYTGQIFQIQEGFGSFMLLSVTDEGYGFWDDNIWVSHFGHIDSAEEDIITVYGTVTGAEEYETQIGGSTYVPKIRAKYVEE